MPCATIPHNGHFGDPSHLRSGPHDGVDLSIPDGTPLQALMPGVARISTRGAWGNKVDIVSGPITLRYAHLSRVSVKHYETVVPGKIIGASGHSGNASGAHLHFGIYVAGVPINPEPFLAFACPVAGAGMPTDVRMLIRDRVPVPSDPRPVLPKEPVPTAGLVNTFSPRNRNCEGGGLLGGPKEFLCLSLPNYLKIAAGGLLMLFGVAIVLIMIGFAGSEQVGHRMMRVYRRTPIKIPRVNGAPSAPRAREPDEFERSGVSERPVTGGEPPANGEIKGMPGFKLEGRKVVKA